MSRELEKRLVDVCERIEAFLGCWVSLGEVCLSDVSTWSLAWCGRWHFLHLCWDWHLRTKCPGRKLFIQNPCSFSSETFRPWGRPLNFVQAYKGSLSTLPATSKTKFWSFDSFLSASIASLGSSFMIMSPVSGTWSHLPPGGQTVLARCSWSCCLQVREGLKQAWRKVFIFSKIPKVLAFGATSASCSPSD